MHLARWFVVLACLLVTRSATADQTDDLSSTTFSDDGKYFAYFSTGVNPECGGDCYYAKVKILSVKNNETLLDESYGGDSEESAEGALSQLRAKVSSKLKKYDVEKTSQSRELYASGTKTKANFELDGKKVELTLKLSDTTDAFDNPASAVVVQLKRNGKTTTMDPQFRGQSINLLSVLLAPDEKSLAVLIKYSTNGFEGPDRHVQAFLVPLK
jgi:predicted secreted protein